MNNGGKEMLATVLKNTSKRKYKDKSQTHWALLT
jgi:hypothetical protein